MKKRTIYSWMLCLSLLAGSVTLNSCRDEFTEEEVLKEQQTIDLAITVSDKYETKGLAGANVSFFQNGQEIKQTTNEAGVANFADVKIGSDLIVTISKEGFATTKQTISTKVKTYRESQVSEAVDMYALDGASTAIIRGKAEIETDVTNDKAEMVPAGTTVEAYYRLNAHSEISVKGQVDANGMYTLKVPATKDGMNYTLRFPTLELDQKIAKNADQGEKKSFPEVLPAIENIKTLFTTSGTGLPVPHVGSVYALATPNDTSSSVIKRPAKIWVIVDDAGKVSSLDFDDYGTGYTGTVTLDIKSVSGMGSGAVVKVQSAFGRLSGTITYENRGANYPTSEEANRIYEDDSNTAVSFNSGSINPFITSSVSIKSGDIKVVNVDYGTGTSRAKGIK